MIGAWRWWIGFVWSEKMIGVDQIRVNNNALEQIESEHNACVEFDCNMHVPGKVFFLRTNQGCSLIIKAKQET